ncbi:MAG: isoleucine--tRNA ligase [Clostridiales bacterium]|nr:isoleucine--tRNA ligase [Clostridiales bacterium]
MYKKVDPNISYVQRELEIEKFWKENKIFEKSLSLREGAPLFTFYDGPPTANGKPHFGHIETRAFKDLIPRYRTMKGYNVLRKAGWDTHGLPVELEVEKMLEISGKPQIETYGIEPFIQKCKESVWKYEKEWREMSDRVAFWVDMDNPYVTYDNNYIESEWWALKTIWGKGLIYKGHKVVPYCPRCGTALSSHEVAQGYKDVTDTTVTAKFKLLDSENEYILAWTTTPWTLPSNVALAVNANEAYIKVLNKSNNEKYILAKALAENNLNFEYEVLDEFMGAQLKGVRYSPLFNYAGDTKEDKHFVVCDDYVTLSDGTGVVHIAPSFGEDDARLGRDYNLPFVQLVGPDGKFINSCGDLSSVFIKDADPIIIKYLAGNNLLFKTESYNHNYPFCWRCDTSLMYYARDTWFIKMTALRDKLVENNNTVNWYPDNVKHGRFGNFLENVLDWGLSRERYWGTPLPIWHCSSCGHYHAIGSIEELKSMSFNCPDDIELHKPYIDKVQLTCPKCGGEMNRTPEVIDCWFDSGAMPFAQHHYPFENKEVFESNFPANFISEAVDQTRGWFYTLMAISTLLFDKPPYENVLVLGHVQDKDGQKMSKHKGNVVDPWLPLNNQGADAVRWYFYTSASPWLPRRFHDGPVNEVQRKFMGTLKNAYAFYVLYANIDNFDPTKYSLKQLGVMDKWILSKLNTLIKYVDSCLDSYKITEPSRAMSDFIDELSNWYIRRSRERFWATGMPQPKINAYLTLYTVLTEFVKLAAPFIPFLSEDIYNNLVLSVDQNAPESVHFCDFPVYHGEYVDSALEDKMALTLQIVTLGRACRNEANLKNRQPLSRLYVKSERGLDDEFIEIIKEELNVKGASFIDDASKFQTYTFKPQLKTLGPKYGKLLPKISQYLSSVDGNKLMGELQGGPTSFEIEGTEVTISLSDVLFESAKIEGYAAVTDKNITAVLDTSLTESLIEEGYVRELISKIQNMRKDSGFDVLDKIEVIYSANKNLHNVIIKNADEIKSETLANSIVDGDILENSVEWNINGEKVALSVKRI